MPQVSFNDPHFRQPFFNNPARTARAASLHCPDSRVKTCKRSSKWRQPALYCCSHCTGFEGLSSATAARFPVVEQIRPLAPPALQLVVVDTAFLRLLITFGFRYCPYGQSPDQLAWTHAHMPLIS
jgi:hypothetical protein